MIKHNKKTNITIVKRCLYASVVIFTALWNAELLAGAIFSAFDTNPTQVKPVKHILQHTSNQLFADDGVISSPHQEGMLSSQDNTTDIKLHGIFYDPNGLTSNAILSVNGSAFELYKQNDVINNNLKLMKILPDAVVLAQQGQEIEIKF